MTDTTAGSNGYDPEKLKQFVDAIEREQDKLDELKIEHLNACRGPRGRIKQITKAVREEDIDVDAFRVVVKKRLDERKHAKRVAELEDDAASAFAMIEAALGEYADTPLGQAALARAKKGETLDSLKQ
jgi:hypothetical protein